MRYKLVFIAVILGTNSYLQDLVYHVTNYLEPYVYTGDFSGCVLIARGDTIVYENRFEGIKH